MNKFECQYCDYSTSRKYNLKRHELAHDSDTVEHNYACAVCNISFRCKSNLKVHYRSARHMKKVKEQCPNACVKVEKKVNGIAHSSYVKIDPLKVSMYLQKVNIVKNKKTKEIISKKIQQIKSEAPGTFDKSKYIDYYKLSENEMEILIGQFVSYLRQRGIDPNDYMDYDYYLKNKDFETPTWMCSILSRVNRNCSPKFYL